MPKIDFVKSYPSIEVPEGENLMQSLLKTETPVASSCNGDGVCGKCFIQVIEGSENLSKESAPELKLKSANQIGGDNRISCQTTVHGYIKIDTPYW